MIAPNVVVHVTMMLKLFYSALFCRWSIKDNYVSWNRCKSVKTALFKWGALHVVSRNGRWTMQMKKPIQASWIRDISGWGTYLNESQKRNYIRSITEKVNVESKTKKSRSQCREESKISEEEQKINWLKISCNKDRWWVRGGDTSH